MLGWVLQGLRTRIVTTRYPAAPEPQPAGARNLLTVEPARCRPAERGECAAVCPTGAITVGNGRFRLDVGSCILCGRCIDACPASSLSFAAGYEVAVRDRADLVVEVGPP